MNWSGGSKLCCWLNMELQARCRRRVGWIGRKHVGKAVKDEWAETVSESRDQN